MSTLPKPIEILVVEDNPGDVFLIRHVLAEERFQVHIRVASDGEQAMRLLAAAKPDLVILDVNVPKISGLSLLDHSQPGVPVVIFTSSSDPQDRRCAFELGVREFVQKPIEYEKYKRVVSEIVLNWASSSNTTSAR